MDFSDFLNKKQKEWDELHPIPDFSMMSDEEALSADERSFSI